MYPRLADCSRYSYAHNIIIYYNSNNLLHLCTFKTPIEIYKYSGRKPISILSIFFIYGGQASSAVFIVPVFVIAPLIVPTPQPPLDAGLLIVPLFSNKLLFVIVALLLL